MFAVGIAKGLSVRIMNKIMNNMIVSLSLTFLTCNLQEMHNQCSELLI